MSTDDKNQSNFKLPSDALTLKNMMLIIMEKSLANMDRLRDREQISQLIRLLKDPEAIQGGVRRIVPTGIVRKVDDLGRVVIPVELRRSLGMSENDSLDISTEGGWVVLKVHIQSCHFCGSAQDVTDFKGKYICETCIGDLFNVVDI